MQLLKFEGKFGNLSYEDEVWFSVLLLRSREWVMGRNGNRCCSSFVVMRVVIVFNDRTDRQSDHRSGGPTTTTRYSVPDLGLDIPALIWPPELRPIASSIATGSEYGWAFLSPPL